MISVLFRNREFIYLLQRPVKMKNILLVEDNPGDIRLTQEALKEAKIEHRLFIVKDGEQALDYLKGTYPQREEQPIPDLILLDLNLPRRSGKEVLKEIKEDKRLRTIPVIVLSTSDAPSDVLESYQLHANCFITKPADINQFIRIVSLIQQFWFQAVQLPTK